MALTLFVAQTLSEPVRIVELDAPLDHVQGLEVGDGVLWVTEVRRQSKTGALHEFALDSGKLLRSVDLTFGARYHPGGLIAREDLLWTPVAEYKPSSSAWVVAVDKKTLKVRRQIEVGSDHIGALVEAGRRLWGANWDARQFVNIASSKKTPNPNATRYQDMKFDGTHIVASGLLDGGGAVDWLDPVSFALVKRLTVGKTDRGVVLTHEGMAIRDGLLYLLPEDGPVSPQGAGRKSRLFIFRLPGD